MRIEQLDAVVWSDTDASCRPGTKRSRPGPVDSKQSVVTTNGPSSKASRVRVILLVTASIAFLLAAFRPAAAIEWVAVGDQGNVADDLTSFGAVAYDFEISKYEITNAEYADFLNAVARDDPNGLYDNGMLSLPGGIARSGSPGSFLYSPISGRENRPVNFVSFYDALRFVNWLHNSRPSGAQGPTTTESGAYTITAEGIAANSIARNAGARFFLTSEDEWYKAAYYGPSYNPAALFYFFYPTLSDLVPTCAPPTVDSNRANCNSAIGPPYDTTPVGSYPGSASPYGTFDQGGNVAEWTEGVSGTQRVRRGGGYGSPPTTLASQVRPAGDPAIGNSAQGFRVARLPPAVPALPRSGAGLLGLFLALAGAHQVSRRVEAEA